MNIKIGFLQYNIDIDGYQVKLGDDYIDLSYGSCVGEKEWKILNSKNSDITLDQYKRVKAILDEGK